MLVGYLALYALFAVAWPMATAAHGAHLVGLLQGFLLGLAVLRNFVAKPWQVKLQLLALVGSVMLLLVVAICNAFGTGGKLTLR